MRFVLGDLYLAFALVIVKECLCFGGLGLG